MSPKMKIAAAAFICLMLVLGGAYGLAKINVIPVQKMGAKTPALGRALRLIGLYHPQPKAKLAAKVAPDPLAADKQALQEQRDTFKKEQADWEAQKQAKAQTADRAKAAATAANPPPDPKQLLRLASIYEQMSPEAVNKIFARLPDDQVIGLLRRMDEKQVGEILVGVTPERAARLTQALARPPVENTTAAVRTAANSP